MNDFLAEMIAGAHERVAAARAQGSLPRPVGGPPAGRFAGALSAAGHRLALIAEVKRRSPSKGDIAPDLNAVVQAQAYQAAGADAISVLTEPSRFGGSLEDLRAVAAAVDLPVLRKDFIVDRHQVYEAAAAGAAAVLLIVAALEEDDLATLIAEAAACGLDALVEVHDEADLRRAVAAGATLLGINNRNLRTLAVDLHVTERLAPLAPADVLLVSESGIRDRTDARRVAAAGAHGLLVGEALVQAGLDQMEARIKALRDAPLPDPATPETAQEGPQ